MPFETLAECLQARASSDADALAFQFHDGSGRPTASLTYAALDQRAQCLAADLVERGAAGRTVVLSYSPGLEFICAFFACQYAGAVPVPAYPPDPLRFELSLSRLVHVIADAGAAIVLTDRLLLNALNRFGQARSWLPDGVRWPVGGRPAAPTQERLQRVMAPDIQWLATDDLPTQATGQLPDTRINGGNLAYLQYTSGSTSQPRGVCLTHGNVLANIAMGQQMVGLDRQTVGVGWVPLYHDLGLVCHVIAAVVIGFPSHLMSPQDFLLRPMSWLELISRYRATHSGAPNFAYQLCVRKADSADHQALDLRSWRVAGNGGEPVRTATLERFCRRFADHGFQASAFMPTYGAAEATLFIASGKPPAQAAKVVHVDAAALAQHRIECVNRNRPGAVGLVSHGRTGAGHELRIVRPGTLDPVPDGCIGEILFRGPSVAAGYHGTEPDVWPFGLKLSSTPALGGMTDPQFLSTGDLGCIHDGELFVTGRLRDLLIVQGRNLYPTDLEVSVESAHEAIRAGSCAVFSRPGVTTESVTVVAELKPPFARRRRDDNGIIEGIMRCVSAEHDVLVDRVVLIPPRSLPKTSSGKVQRGLARQQLERGELPVLTDFCRHDRSAPVPVPVTGVDAAPAMATAVTALLTDVLQRPITTDDPLPAAALDSLALIDIAEAIRQYCGVRLGSDAILQAGTAKQLARLIEAHDGFSDWQPPKDESVEYARQRARFAGRQPASGVQRLFWDMHHLLPGSYRNHVLLELKGSLNRRALEQAWTHLLEDNAIVRASYALSGSRLEFSIVEPCTVPIDWCEAQAWPRRQLRSAIRDELRRPFDLAAPPLARCRVYQRSSGVHLLQLVVHHIAIDLWSFARLFEDLLRMYAALAGNVSIRRRVMPLPVAPDDTDRSDRPPVSVSKLAVIPAAGALLYSTGACQLAAAQVRQLYRQAEQWRVSLPVVLLTAYSEVLAELMERSSLCIAIPLSMRTTLMAEVSGPMLQFLPVMLDRLPEAAPDVQARHLGGLLADVLDRRATDICYAADGSDFPDVHFTFHDFDRLRMSERMKDLHLGRSVMMGDLTVSMESSSAIETVSPVAVGLMAVLVNDEMTLWLNARPDVLSRDAAERLMQAVLARLTTAPVSVDPQGCT